MKTNTKLIGIANKYKNKVMSTLLMSTMVINSASPFVFADVENVENIETIVNTENTETVVNIENTETNENTVLEIPENTENTENIVENETETETTIETENIVENNVENETENNIETETENIVVENPENIEMAGPRMPNENEENIENIGRAGPAEERSANTETENRSAGDSQDVIDNSVSMNFTTSKKTESGENKLDYLTGEDILVYANFVTNNENFVMKNAKLKLTIPKNNIEAKPNFTDTRTGAQKTETSDNDNWYVTYTYDELRSGVMMAIPISYKMTRYTPNNFTTDIKLELINNENNVVKSENIVITSKADDNLTPIIYTNFKYNSCYTEDENYTSNSNKGRLKTINHSGYDDVTNVLNFGENFTASKSSVFCYNIALDSSVNNENGYGVYIPKNLKIDIELPEGVVYTGSLSREKTYNPETRILTINNPSFSLANYSYSIDEIQKNLYTLKSIRFNYAGLPYNTEIDGLKVTITLDPGAPNERILDEVTSSKIKFTYTKLTKDMRDAFAPSTKDIKYFRKTLENETFEKKFGIYNYDIAQNQNVSELILSADNYQNNDNADKIYYENLRIINTDAYEFFKNNPHKIIGIKEDDSEVIISDTGFVLKNLDDIAGGFETINISDTAGEYKKIKIKFDNPANINTNLGNYDNNDFLSLGFRVKDGEIKNVDSNTNIRFTITGVFPDSNSVRGRYSDFSFRNYPKPFISTMSTRSLGNVFYDRVNNIRTITNIQYASYKHELDNIFANGAKYIMLLPIGVEYVPEKGENNYTIIDNYKNTGKTAVIIDLGDLEVSSPYKYKDLPSRKIKITSSTNEGENVIEHYLIWENNKDDEVYQKGDALQYIDNLDLDDDGDLTEKFTSASTSFTFIPPFELNISQFTSDTKVSENINQNADIGGDIYYKIKAFNNFTSDVNNLTVYDVLPAIGDKSIVPDIGGAYYDRGTQFVPTMVESIESIPENSEAIKKFDIYYSTDSQGDGIDSVKNATWKTADQITDFSTVKMLKFQLKESEKFAQGLSVDFLIHTKVPKDVNITEGLIAVNSVAFTRDGTNFIESNKTVNTITRYNVSGVVFEDKGSDGILADRDTRLADYTVALMKSDGTPALNLDNQTITTTTNSNGEYNFTVYARGDYYVAVTKKDNSQTPTIKVAGNNGNSAIADANDNSIIKSILNINPSQNNYIANAGFNIQVTDGVITINLHEEGNRSNKLIGGIFEIYDSTKTRLIETLTTKINGIVTSADLSYGDYVVVNKTPAENYKLSEIVEKNISLTGASSSVVFTNIRKTQSEIFVLNNPELTSVLNLTNLTTTEKNNVSNAIKTANPTAPIKTVVIANNGIATITFNDNSTTTISSDKTIKQLTFAQRNTINLPDKTRVNNISSLSEEEKNLVIEKINDRNRNKNIKNITVANDGIATIIFDDDSTKELTQEQTVIQKTHSELNTINPPEKIKVNNISSLSEEEKNLVIEKINDRNRNKNIKNITVANDGIATIIFDDDSTKELTQEQTVIQKTHSELNTINPPEKIKVNNISSLSEEEKNLVIDKIKTANPNWDNLSINSIVVNSNGSVNIVFNDNSSTGFTPNQTVIQKTQAELFDPENITQVEVLDYDNRIYYFENIKFMDGVDSLKDIHYNNANEFRLIFKDNSTLNIEKNKLFKQKEFEKIPVFDIKKLSEEEKQTGLEFLRTFLSPKIIDIDFDYANGYIQLGNWDYEYYTDRLGDLEYLDYSIIFEQYDRAKGESVTAEDLPTINMSDIITLTLPDITSVDDIVRVSNQEKEIVKSKIITKNPLLENMNFEIDNSGNTKIIFPDNSIITLVGSQTVKENPKIGPGGQAPNSIIQTVVPTSTPEIIKNISILPTPEIIKNIPTLSENPDILNSAPEIIFDLSEKNFENISEKNISEKNSENIIKTENNQEKNENPNSEIIKNPIENNSIIQNNPEKNPTKLKLPDFLPATGFENVFMIFVFSSIISYAIISSRRRFDD